jgi:hypothetical protein
MIFDMFAKAKQPPLTAFCTKLSAPENLIRVAGIEATKASSRTDKRAVVLSLTIMAAAGFFVERFRWDRGVWKSSRRYLRDTNLDVITAEAIVWVHSLLGEALVERRAERPRNDRENWRFDISCSLKNGSAYGQSENGLWLPRRKQLKGEVLF